MGHLAKRNPSGMMTHCGSDPLVSAHRQSQPKRLASEMQQTSSVCSELESAVTKTAELVLPVSHLTNWRGGTGGCPPVSLTVQNTSRGMASYRTLKEVEVSSRRSCLARSWESPSITPLCPYLYRYSVLTLQRDSSGGHSGAVLSKISNLSLCCISNKPCISSLTTAGISFLKHDFGD